MQPHGRESALTTAFGPSGGRAARPLVRRRHLLGSMESRIVAMTWLCAVATALAIGAMAYYEVRTTAQSQAVERLASETRLMAVQFEDGYRMIETDLQTLGQTPPITGMIRSARNGGTDPRDGSSEQVWKQRLATIFRAVLRSRPEYFQIRYIGFGDNGLELVRVERGAFGVNVTAESDLQEKGGEPYAANAAEAAANTIVFSEVTYNREHGAIDPRGIPTIRGMLPIDDTDGNRFGFLVVNVDYEKMLRSAFAKTNPQFDMFVVNGLGDYMFHEAGQPAGLHRLILSDTQAEPVPAEVAAFARQAAREGEMDFGDTVAYFVRETGQFAQTAANLGLIVQVPKRELFARANALGNRVLIVGLLIVFACGALAAMAARSVIRPLIRLSDTVRSNDERTLVHSLPVDRRDEVGDLAIVLRERTQALIDSETRSSAIVEHVADGLILIDDHGTIEEFNPSCEKMFGYTAREVIGRNVKMLMPSDIAAKHDGFLTRYRDGDGGDILETTRELEAITKAGTAFPVELSLNVLEFAGKTKFGGVIRDISARKEIDRLRAEFVATVSHELRTPLTSIRGSLVLTQTLMPKPVPVKIEKMLGLAQSNTERLILLVNDILDFEKLEANKTRFDLARFDLNDLMVQAADLNQTYAQDRDVRLVARPDDAPLPAMVDKDRFQQVLANLISNAAKFSPEGETVEIRATREGQVVQLRVVDNGPGISEDFQDRIFTPFSQAETDDARKKGGSGLGLNITKRLVEGMGGKIGFDTRVGAGTTFWLEFPFAGNSALPKPDRDPAQPGRLVGLHLEDDTDFAEVLRASLEDEVTLVNETTLEGAKARLKEQAFDLVVIDVGLIEENTCGLDLLDYIPDPDDTIVVVITAFDEKIVLPYIDATIVKSRTLTGELTSTLTGLLVDKKKDLDRIMAAVA